MNMLIYRSTIREENLRRAIRAVSQLSGVKIPVIDKKDGFYIGNSNQEAVKVIEIESRDFKDSIVRHIGAETGIILTKHVTQKMASLLLNHNVQYIDEMGNARLKLGDSFIYISGQRVKHNTQMPTRLSKPLLGQKIPLKILYVLLKNSDLLNATYREIAKTAQVALGSVSKVISSLKSSGDLIENNKGQYIFRDINDVIEKWALMYPIVLKPSLEKREFEFSGNGDQLLDIMDPRTISGVWGDSAGGCVLTNYLTITSAAIYIGHDDAPKFINMAKLRKKKSPEEETPNISVTIYEPFWNTDTIKQPYPACPLITYSDLLASNDPRFIDTSNRIKDEYLGFI
ncbi:type IV toxin-antitoxin system AbiEi family antitoxin [Bermanella sp. R86510]|uniref:type IV toxin-antitoxin system AbiEi family antitoxin n=1 Tax=unclassified Bermanella TaxID=2627862 RepID=UPI0037CA0BFA